MSRDETTEFTEGQDVYLDSGMGGLTPAKVEKVKYARTRGGLRVTVTTTGGAEWDGSGSPRKRGDMWSTAMVRPRTDDLDRQYRRQVNVALVSSAIDGGQIRLWDDEELDLLADAVRVAKGMRRQRIVPLQMEPDQFKAAVAALPRGETSIVRVSNISTAHAKQYVSEVFHDVKHYVSAEVIAGVTVVRISFY